MDKRRILLAPFIGLCLLLLLLSACSDKKESPDDNSPPMTENDPDTAESVTTVTADNFLDTLMARNGEAIHAQMAPDFQQQVPLADLQQIIDQVLDEYPVLADASGMTLNGGDMRMWTDPEMTLGVTVIFDQAGTIIGLQFQDITLAESSPPEPTKLVYDYPVQGEWFVFWGGDNVIVNYHAAVESQRFAYDLIQVADHYSYAGDPLKNESYHAFGQPIVAPADGVVVQVVSDVPDNEPVGVMNDKEPLGNVVVIDHNGEYSYLAHLQHDSVRVAVGDPVKRGDVVGLTGNSGNSSEPHLHFQVSDGPEVFTSRSLDIRWSSSDKPIQGQTIQGF